MIWSHILNYPIHNKLQKFHIKVEFFLIIFQLLILSKFYYINQQYIIELIELI